ncbi:MAG: methionine--tRNA ligase [Elusimicrobia bacterium RIFOXYD2_FULL_34_15]|nr:MAG: methionine--tRNA ligase [Elusimicrobia bacterium RIFOXYD2_FULL_34_15]
MKKFYITTPIYYVNDKPHLGHSYTTIAADILARYCRSKNVEVFYLTGTDEHGSKIAEAASKNGFTPQEWVDKNVEEFKLLWERLNISYDYFIRTTGEKHVKKVQEVFSKLLKTGDIYKGKYSGWYCVACESYYTDTQILSFACPDCAKEVWKLEEESYFFKLSKYQDALLEYYEKHPEFLQPSWRALEMKNFVKSGLKDLSVSRTKVKWGITVPGDEAHTIYVWFDALLNYLSAAEGKNIWPCDVHFIGKEIFKFHAVIWSAMLMALGEKLPKTVFAHGWWTVNGEKMSKSKGNFVNPHTFIDNYGCDAYRYFVMSQIPFGQDGDFSEKSFFDKYNSNLANNLGNLISRTFSMLEKFSLQDIKAEVDKESSLGKLIVDFDKKYSKFMESIEFIKALELIWEVINEANKTIDSEKPWNLFKIDKVKLEKVLKNLLSAIEIVSKSLSCFMPETSEKIKKIIMDRKVTEPLFPRKDGKD